MNPQLLNEKYCSTQCMRVDITCRQFIIYIVAVSGNHVDAWEDKETCFKHIKIKLNLLRKYMQIYRTLLVEKFVHGKKQFTHIGQV